MNFRLIRMRELGQPHFEEWPVWSEYYEPDELEEITAWGVDPDGFFQQLQSLALGNEHAAYPVLEYDPLPARMRLYIKARFRTARGDELSGYVVNDDAYAGEIFLGGNEYGFNIHMRKEVGRMLESLARELGAPASGLLPITYETGVRTEDGEVVAGTLDLS